ncbi:MAG: cation diffusion facilitator family transporter [Desulfobacterales bacterium]|nr:cation diffusion facilitator family transporter [Desulfobacterales bacterium]
MLDATRRSAETDKETRQIQKVVLYAFLINIALAALKGALAVISGSLAVTAGAIDSLTDAFASVAVYVGVKLSSKQFRNFPLGLYKIENVISVIVAFFILFVGYEIARRIFMDTGAPPPDISPWVVLLIALATFITFMFGQYALHLGRKTESPTLIAEGHHRQADVLSSLVVFLSVFLNYAGITFNVFGLGIDHLAAGIVLVFIAMAGWRLLSDGMRVLLDASVDSKTLASVREIICEEPAVIHIKSLVGRNSGRFRFIQASITLRTQDLKKAHDISRRIEHEIHDRVPHVGRIMIHYEPEASRYRRIAVPMEDTEKTISSHFGEAPYFVIFTLDRNQGQMLGKTFEKNPYLRQTHGKGIQVAEWLISHHHIDELVVNSDMKHKGPGYVFANAGVNPRIVETDNLDAVIDIFFSQPERTEKAPETRTTT